MLIKIPALYLAGGLFLWASFQARAADLDWVRVAPSGKSIIFQFKDASGELGAGVKTLDPSVHPAITINGGQPLELREAIYAEPKGREGESTALPYIIYPLFGPVLKAADKVTVSVSGNWVKCNGGPIGPLQNVVVENYVGKSLLPPPPTDYKMQVGMNMACGLGTWRANALRQKTSYDYKMWYDPEAGITLGENGVPTVVTDHTVFRTFAKESPGDWTLMWDGKDKLAMTNSEVTLTSETLTGNKDNKRIYTAKVPFRGFIELKFEGAAVNHVLKTDVHHLRLYPPGVKTDGSQEFHPEFLRQLSGTKCIRFMHTMLSAGKNLERFEQMRSDQEELQVPFKPVTLNIIKVGPFEDTQGVLWGGGSRAGVSHFKLTTDQPHHFKSGEWVQVFLNAPDGSIPMTNGAKFNKWPGMGTDSMVYVISPTEFAILFWAGGSQGTAQREQEIQGTATISFERCDMWLSEMVDLVNAIDGCDLWICVPLMFDDDNVSKLFEYIGKRLKPNRKVHVEYGNEIWNYTGGTWGCYHINMMGHLDPDPLVQKNPWCNWYVKRSAQVQAVARETFNKLGRRGDILGVIATQNGAVNWVNGILNYAKASNVSFDEFSVASYWAVGPATIGSVDVAGSAQANLREIVKKLDVDQVCDMADMYVQHTNILPGIAEALKKQNFQGQLVTYEGGPCGAGLVGMNMDQAAKMSFAWDNHPRMGPWLRYYLQRLQDKDGVALQVHFDFSTRYNGHNWGVYPLKWDQKDGLGDGSDGLFNNLSNLDSNECVSVKGYWFHDWYDHYNKSHPPVLNKP